MGRHVGYLRELIEAAKIRASGPASGLGKRAGFIIITVDTAEEVQRLIDAAPFAIEGLIDDLTILAWDPMFGAFSKESSRRPSPAP